MTFHPAALAETAVDRLREAAMSGEISKVQFADSLLSLAEVDHAAIENPEVLMLRFPGFADIIGQRLVERVGVHALDGKTDEVRQLSLLAEKMLGTSSIYTQKVRRVVQLQKKYDALVSRGTVDTASAFRAELATPEERQLYEPKLNAFMERTIRLQLNLEKPFSGLSNMANLGTVSQPPALVSAVKQLLDSIIAKTGQGTLSWNASTLKDVRVEKLLSDLQKKDPEVTNKLITIHEMHARDMAAAGSLDEAKASLKWVTSERSDPNEKNTALRKAILFSLSGEQASEFAQDLIATLVRRDALSFSEKIKLYNAGYYWKGTILTLLVATVVLLFLLIGAFYAIGKRYPEFSIEHISAQLQEYHHNRMIRKNEKRGVGYTSVVQHEDQYSKLLAEFGLDDSATDADIKKAYRQLVKAHHPDAHGADGRVMTEDGKTDRTFEELKKNYNRLMEMRKSFFTN